MLDFLNKYRRDYKFSQNGEEGILIECVRRLAITQGSCVEIGGHDGRWCSNTAYLIEHGWSGKFVETDFNLWQQCRDNWANNSNVKAICSHVDCYNINAFVDANCDVLSLDTDGSDYQIFKGLRAKPKIVIVEIDSSFPPDQSGFNADGGASYRTMVELGLSKGYFVLAHTGNLIFIDEQYRELFPDIEGDPLVDTDLYFNPAWLKAA